ncbi:SDR family oxidoreductase [Microbacterium abyssi]|uniref:SDR family oxidoreductase n=1 Tax=Microbacterium abyssi TaxID=2782166 RepID=UPI001888DB55|nr:SDR family oxidoreductase [Microbacterium sp. A18JL241]
MSDLFDLTGLRAVVTGANRGIGFGMATALADAGADIIGVSTSIPDSGSEIESAVLARGRAFRAIRCDLSDATSVATLCEELRSAEVDILINNAGTILRAPSAEHPMEWFERVVQVNLTSQFALAQAVGASMLERGRGKIVFTASLLSFQGGINVPGYAAAKSGITGVVKALANEWACRGVNVNAIAPGYIATDNTQALRDDPERSRAILDRIPAGRWGEASDLGGAAVFLSSPASDYVNGTVLPVDGGWLGR